MLRRILALAAILSGGFGGSANSEQARESQLFRLLKLDGHQVRWQPPADGAPIVTYRLLNTATEFGGARNCASMTSLEGLVHDSQLSMPAVQSEIRAAFAMWEAVANIRFQEVPSDIQADISIGAQREPDGWAFADVFYDVAAPGATKPISRSLVCLNPSKRWKVGFDGDLKTYDIRYTVAHEIGHAIGLDHPQGLDQMMGYRYEERFRTLQPGDVSGAVALYGPSHQPSQTETAASVQTAPAVAPQPKAFAGSAGTRGLSTRSR